VNLISNNVNNENLNIHLKEIGSQRLEELFEESMSKNKSTQNISIKELRKIAKEKNIKGYSKMKKAELLQKIRAKSRHERSEIGEQPSAMKPFAFEDSYFTEFSKKPKIKIIETKAEYTKKWKKLKFTIKLYY
jgi:hypothetical protein